MESLDGEFSPIAENQLDPLNKRGCAYRQVEQTGTGWQKTKMIERDQADKKRSMLTGQTDGTDETDIDCVFVTEACCTEVDLVLSGYGDDLANSRRRQEGHL